MSVSHCSLEGLRDKALRCLVLLVAGAGASKSRQLIGRTCAAAAKAISPIGWSTAKPRRLVQAQLRHPTKPRMGRAGAPLAAWLNAVDITDGSRPPLRKVNASALPYRRRQLQRSCNDGHCRRG